MKTVYITKGLPASGKTTWSKEFQASNPDVYRVNKDDLRSMLHDSVHTKGNEKFVIKVRDLIIEEALKGGHSIIVDDTNLNPIHEENIRVIAKRNNAVVKIQTFNVSLDECIERDLERKNSVGETVIVQMYDQYIGRKELDLDPETTWIITDTHFHHEKLVREAIRPENYNELIVKNWNDVVKETDTVIHLGDVIFGDKSKLPDILHFLNGKKILVKGNHDYKPNKFYIDAGFDMVCNQLVFNDVLFTHTPQPNIDEFVLNIHGHLHNNEHRIEEVRDILTPKHKLIALEDTEYKPIKLKDLL